MEGSIKGRARRVRKDLLQDLHQILVGMEDGGEAEKRGEEDGGEG